jgi:glycerol-3-phosphate dehydrogenase
MALRREYPHLAEATAERLARSYGSEAQRILAAAPGGDFGHGLTEAELRWLVENEWARTAEDVLWRRTKLGLRFTPGEARTLDDYLRRSAPSRADAADLPAGQTAYR